MTCRHPAQTVAMRGGSLAADRPRARSLGALALAALVVLATLVAVPRGAHAAPVPVTDAPALTWGFKGSWRTYAKQPTVAGGATIVPETSSSGYNLNWDFASGSYEADARRTVLRYAGSAQWRSHPTTGFPVPPGYAGPLDIDQLDLTLTDPEITIGQDGATITAETKSRNAVTWQMVDYGRIPIVDLTADEVAPVVAGGTTTWSGIPAAIAQTAGAPFGEVYYPEGTRVDPVSFSYTGPGGAPDFSDQFDGPDVTRLGLDGDNVELVPSSTEVGTLQVVATDTVRKLVYYRVQQTVGEMQWEHEYRVFDLATMRDAPIEGPPLRVPVGSLGAALLVKSDDGKVYLSPSSSPQIQHWIRYDSTRRVWEQGDDATAIPSTSAVSWDPVGKRAFQTRLIAPAGVGATDYDRHVWKLVTYSSDDAGTWTQRDYDLPSAPTGLNFQVYNRLGVAASDGSIVVPGARQQVRPAGTATLPTTVPGAYRIVTHDDGTATTAPVAGTTVPNVNGGPFTAALAGPDGMVALTSGQSSGKVQRVDVTPPAGQPLQAEPPVDLGFAASELAADGFTVDPEDGTVWVAGMKSRRIVGVGDGRIVADQVFARRSARGGPLVGLAANRLVMQSGDGVDGELTTQAFGFQKLQRLGTTATVTTDPEDRSVALGVGETARDVTFTAAATGSPEPTLQWQRKAPGSTRFRDVAGATDGALVVSAQPGTDGTQYRAVFANAAGRVATEPATLGVSFAPRVGFDLVDQTVSPGQSATFDVLADGDPAPQVTWQRRVAGFWASIDPDDENFLVTESRLTVPDTNLDQSGALFRARLRSELGTVYTRAAKLTVQAPAARDLVGVRLDWTGSQELQRKAPNLTANFFSAGTSDGTEATYASAAPGVRVLHVAADGTESRPAWGAREAFLAGGGSQLVRLIGGMGRVEADGSSVVRWTGSFTVNMYGGLVPFTVSNPVLELDADGNGTLTATFSGYASSIANPTARTPIAPVSGVRVATITGGRIDPGAPSTIRPDYAGVRVETGGGQAPQDRDAAGWGAWPQSFVDVQLQTGLGSYWYSSGGAADPYKAPDPFVVTVTGERDDTGGDPPPIAVPIPPVTSIPPFVAPPAPPTSPAVRAPELGAAKRSSVVARRTGKATVTTVTCRSGPCRISAPRTVRVRIAGRSYTARVLGRTTVNTGRRQTLRVQLSRAAIKRLAASKGRRGSFRVRVVVRSPAKTVARTVTVSLR
ncbi:MAG: HtaA domain-containing protein [Patulibacter sp.]